MRLGLLYWFNSDGVKLIAICNVPYVLTGLIV